MTILTVRRGAVFYKQRQFLSHAVLDPPRSLCQEGLSPSVGKSKRRLFFHRQLVTMNGSADHESERITG